MRNIHVSVFIASLLAVLSALIAIPLAHAATSPGSLVKISCPAGAGSAHPCRAVYFYGSDGKRHAFPNERVFFSWYKDFSTVQTIDANSMAALPLGQNVTYRPGVTMVKFLTDNRVFAVSLGGTLRWVASEQAASALYGSSWNTRVQDINDTFFTDYRFSAQINQASDYALAAELAAAKSVDDDLPATRRSVTVSTSSGNFTIDVIKLQKDRFRMVSVTGNTSDCGDGCTARPLGDYALDNVAPIGIHGTYFCPPDYSGCVEKVYSFLWPVFNSSVRVMINNSSLPVHHGPMLTQSTDGTFRYFHRTKDFGSSVSAFEAANSTTLGAAMASYPSLIENSALVVDNEPMLEDAMKTAKVTRGGIGFDDRFLYLVIARSATVPDLARIFQSIGATYAMNLDGGGSSAMMFDGNYVVGPGRQLPNALLFLLR